MKLETHCHTLHGSNCADCPEDITVKKYFNAGYNGVVITNHFNAYHFSCYPGDSDKEKLDYYFSLFDNMTKKFSNYSIKTFLGAEVPEASLNARESKGIPASKIERKTFS